jgi:hypothetical protein
MVNGNRNNILHAISYLQSVHTKILATGDQLFMLRKVYKRHQTVQGQGYYGTQATCLCDLVLLNRAALSHIRHLFLCMYVLDHFTEGHFY